MPPNDSNLSNQLNLQEQQRWNKRYSKNNKDPKVAKVLLENQHLLSSQGEALEIACGMGGNALFLAKHGYDVTAWDISDVAIGQLDIISQKSGIKVTTEVRDIIANPPPVKCFDLIVVSRFFLEQEMSVVLINALKPGGLLFYQTFTQTKVTEIGPSNPEFRMHDNQLLQNFNKLQILVYREEGIVGDISQGFRDEAMLVGQKVEQ
ncbi:MAG: methyltransferase domain-containing protein [Magnetococcales bacterium]|nr:methyltransferase domain-containing protein [Magnetococcales bacterium]